MYNLVISPNYVMPAVTHMHVIHKQKIFAYIYMDRQGRIQDLAMGGGEDF